MKLFPIMNSVIFHAIPLDLIAPHEAQAKINHDQTLDRLADRGGLDPCEAIAVLEGKRFWDRWGIHGTGNIGAYKEMLKEAEEALLETVSSHIHKDTFETIIEEIMQHDKEHPDHGLGCACHDKHAGSLRSLIYRKGMTALEQSKSLGNLHIVLGYITRMP